MGCTRGAACNFKRVGFYCIPEKERDSEILWQISGEHRILAAPLRITEGLVLVLGIYFFTLKLENKSSPNNFMSVYDLRTIKRVSGS